MQGHHKLAKQSGGIGLFAEVRVRVDEGSSSSIAVSETAFAWLKDDYGPDAWEWSICDAYRSGALAGVRFAVTRLAKPRSNLSVIIEEIRARPVDTTPECVAYAACRATWEALGDPGDGSLEIQGRHILFAGKRAIDE